MTPRERAALKGCLDAMFMQERRECEDFHLSPVAARAVWDKARDEAAAVLFEESVPGTDIPARTWPIHLTTADRDELGPERTEQLTRVIRQLESDLGTTSKKPPLAKNDRDHLARELETAETHRAQSKIRAKEAERERDEVIAKFNRMQEAHVNLNRDLYEQRAQRDRRIAELEAALRGLFDASDHVLGVQWRATTLNVADGDELNRAWDDANAALSAPASPAPATSPHNIGYCSDILSCPIHGAEPPAEREATKLVHFARVPFQAVCGADVPNQSTTASRGIVTCAACVEATVAREATKHHCGAMIKEPCRADAASRVHDGMCLTCWHAGKRPSDHLDSQSKELCEHPSVIDSMPAHCGICGKEQT